MKNNLKRIRTKKKLTLMEIAVSVGVQPSTILNYERGVRNPDIQTARNIAEALEASVDQIWPPEKVRS